MQKPKFLRKGLKGGTTKRILTVAPIVAIIAVVSLMILGSVGSAIPVTSRGNTMTPSALSSELGKAKFIGNESLNVSWTAFTSQSTGKVFYSQSSKITDTSSSVNFTTKNYTTINKLEIGTYYILIQNGSTFPSLSTEFKGTVPVSSVLEKFSVNYVGNNIFNVSWKSFKGQSSVSVYYALGNGSKITDKSNYTQVTTANSSFVEIKGALTSVSFLIVNGSAYPAGEVNVTNYTVTVTGFQSLKGGFLFYDGIGLGFFATYEGMAVDAVIGLGVIAGSFYIGRKTKGRKN